MASQTRTQIITIYILPNISRRKGNQTMTFGQLIEYNMRNGFLQNHVETETGRLLPEPFSFFKKALYEVKASGQHLSFNIFGSPQFEKKGLEIVSLSHFVNGMKNIFHVIFY